LVISRRSPSMVTTTFSLSASTSNAGKLFGHGPRGLPGWPFLNQLRTPPPYCHGEVSPYLAERSAIMNSYVSNNQRMPSGDPRIFGFPCRFPATPSIPAVVTTQVYDRTRFFGMGGVPKNFFPGFPARQGKGEAVSPVR
jgi:hypothetical protein